MMMSAILFPAWESMAEDSNSMVLTLENKSGYDDSMVFFILTGVRSDTSKTVYLDFSTGSFVDSDPFTFDASTMTASLAKIKTLNKEGNPAVAIPKPSYQVNSGRLYFSLGDNFDKGPAFTASGQPEGKGNTLLFDKFEFYLGGPSANANFLNQTNVDHYAISYTVTAYDCNFKKVVTTGITSPSESIYDSFLSIISSPDSQNYGNTDLFKQLMVKNEAGQYVRVIAPKAPAYSDLNAAKNEQQKLTHFFDDYINKHCWKPNRMIKFHPKDNATTFYYGKVSADGKTLHLYTDDKMTKPYAKVPTIERPGNAWGSPDFAGTPALWQNVGGTGHATNQIDWGFAISGQAKPPAGLENLITYKLADDPVAMTIPISICRGVMHLNEFDPKNPTKWIDSWSDSTAYYKGNNGTSTSDMPVSYYGKILHGAASGGFAYAYSYDDVYGANSGISFRQPDVKLTLYPVLSAGKGAITVLTTAGGDVSPKGFKEYTLNSKVAVTATPANGYKFTGWTVTKGVTVDDTSKASATATVTGIGILTANFEHLKSDLTMAANGDGTTVPAAGTTTSVNQYEDTPITANANAGSTFVNWTITGNATIADASAANTAVSLKGDANVTANFHADANVAVSGTPIAGIDGSQDDKIVYKVTVPAGITKLIVSTGGGAGDCDIYAKPNFIPSCENFYARSVGSTGTETITVLNPIATDWFILIHAYGNFTGYALNVTLLADVPGIPTLLTANRTSPSSVALTWTDCSGTGAQSYHVFRSEDNFTSSAHQLTSVNGVASKYYHDNTTVPGTHYYYWVKSANASGISDFSNSLQDVDLAGEFESAAKNLINGSVVSGIKGDAGTTSKYKITVPVLVPPAVLLEIRTSGGAGDCELSAEKDGTVLNNGVRSGTNETIRIENPAAGDYLISLFANKAFSGVTLFVKYYNAKPLAPSGVNAGDGKFSDSILVSWNAAAGAASYEVWRGTSTNSALAVKIAEVPGLSHVDISTVKNPLDSSTCYYWVKAKNGAGTSLFSTSNAGSLTDIPNPPGTFTATKGIYFDKIRLTWTAAPTAASYLIYRNTTPDFIDENLIAEVPQQILTTLSYDDLGSAILTTDTTYYYFIKSKNGSGPSDKYRTATGSLNSKPVTGVTASRGTYFNKVKVTWNSLAGASGYIVYRSDDANSLDVLTDQVGTSGTNVYYDTPPLAGIPYVYWVVADYNGFYQTDLGPGALGWSAPGVPATLASPVLKSVGNGESNLVRVAWAEVPLAVSYNVYRRVLATDPWGIPIANTTDLFLNDNPPLEYQKYMYCVSSVNGAKESAKSAPMSGYKAGDSTDFAKGDAPILEGGEYQSRNIYRITVPAGCSRFVATLTPVAGTTGDCDLYAKFGMYPTMTSYYAKGVELSGTANREVLTVTNPVPGDWYILLYGASPADFSNVNFSASYYFATDIVLTQVPADDLPVPFTAVFKGKVLDEAGAGIPGMTVGVRDPVTGYTSWLAKTDANGLFTYSRKIDLEGEFTYDFYLSTIPDVTRSIASCTLKTARGFKESNGFFDFSGYLPRESLSITQNDAFGLQTYFNIRRGFTDGIPDSDYEDMWIENTIATSSYDTNIVSKLDSGLYFIYYGSEGAAVGNANIAGNVFTSTPLLMHVSPERQDAVLGNLKSNGLIENELADKVLGGGIGVVVITAVSNPDQSGFNFDYDVSLYAQEQLELLAKLAGNTNVSASTTYAERKYGDFPVKFMNVSINQNVRRITVAVGSFME